MKKSLDRTIDKNYSPEDLRKLILKDLNNLLDYLSAEKINSIPLWDRIKFLSSLPCKIRETLNRIIRIMSSENFRRFYFERVIEKPIIEYKEKIVEKVIIQPQDVLSPLVKNLAENEILIIENGKVFITNRNTKVKRFIRSYTIESDYLPLKKQSADIITGRPAVNSTSLQYVEEKPKITRRMKNMTDEINDLLDKGN